MFQEMKKVVDLINCEIEYVLRPRTAPNRHSSAAAPRLKTAKRASSGRSQSLDQSKNKSVRRGGRGYPRIVGRRSVSPHPLSPDGVVPVNQRSNATMDKRKQIRNLQVSINNITISLSGSF